MRRAPLVLLVVLLASLPSTSACAGSRAASQGSTGAGGDPCADFDVQVERYWSGSIKAQVLDKGGEIQLEQRSGIVNKMDRISEDWVMMRTSVCKDHFVRGLIDKDEYAARVQCFDDRLARQRTIAEALTGADAELAAIDSSLDAILAEPASCQPH